MYTFNIKYQYSIIYLVKMIIENEKVAVDVVKSLVIDRWLTVICRAAMTMQFEF
jgi:hypothetical protein